MLLLLYLSPWAPAAADIHGSHADPPAPRPPWQMDVWALGMIACYHLLLTDAPWWSALQPPPNAGAGWNQADAVTQRMLQLYLDIPSGQAARECNVFAWGSAAFLSHDTKDFLWRCLQPDASLRPTPQELINHSAMRKVPSVLPASSYMREVRPQWDGPPCMLPCLLQLLLLLLLLQQGMVEVLLLQGVLLLLLLLLLLLPPLWQVVVACIDAVQARCVFIGPRQTPVGVAAPMAFGWCARWGDHFSSAPVRHQRSALSP
jgi:hypothetical protein